ncbi:hypothetical protein ACFC5X_10270 [Streptomyces sp. NPDC055952]|uniref:hypothetical protein n=1 Tax=Streptomyces sp. NPDC055952 TaxID=3345663 RepID=UPI0035E15468
MTQAEWIAAFIAAGIVAIFIDMITILRGKVTKQLPFLLLRVARLRVPRHMRHELHDEVWVPDLQAHLTNKAKGKLRRYWQGVAFAMSLALWGAKATANAMSPRPWTWLFFYYGRLYDFAFVGSVLLEGVVAIASARFDLTWPWVACLSGAQVIGVVIFTRWRRKVGRERYGLPV